MEHLTDDQLASAAARGEVAAFSALYDRHAGRIHRVHGSSNAIESTFATVSVSRR